jgi:hypothetical protein
MRRITIQLSRSADTSHVPLACLGYALRQAEVLKSLQDIKLPLKTVAHSPAEKLIEALVLILAGGRATAQIDLLLRPNCALAQAWGQTQFAQQATVADTLDALDATSIELLRRCFETLFKDYSHTRHHDFRTGDLWLDGDLTGLPAARRAEGSTHGYFAGEKTVSDANWRA